MSTYENTHTAPLLAEDQPEYGLDTLERLEISAGAEVYGLTDEQTEVVVDNYLRSLRHQ